MCLLEVMVLTLAPRRTITQLWLQPRLTQPPVLNCPVLLLSMGIGSIFLLAIGFYQSGVPTISFNNWLFLLWLAIINTAFAFTLWNKTLQSLTAMESSIINGTMLIQIAILAWIFLGESITLQEGIGMTIAAIGAVIVQYKRQRRDVPSK